MHEHRLHVVSGLWRGMTFTPTVEKGFSQSERDSAVYLCGECGIIMARDGHKGRVAYSLRCPNCGSLNRP